MLRQMKSASAMIARITRIVISMNSLPSRWIERLALVWPARRCLESDPGCRKAGTEHGDHDEIQAGERQATLACAT